MHQRFQKISGLKIYSEQDDYIIIIIRSLKGKNYQYLKIWSINVLNNFENHNLTNE